MDVRDNPYWQALAAVIAELEDMGVDLGELQARVSRGLQEEEKYACKDRTRALAGIEALTETVIAFQYSKY